MCKNGAADSSDDFDDGDRRAMRRALRLAKTAADNGEAPVGAVVYTAAGDVVGEGKNATVGDCDITAHAEMAALRAAFVSQKNHRLPHLKMAVTLEPCAMCAGAIFQARLAKLVFAAADDKTGVCGGVVSLHLQKKINHHTTVVGGLFAAESAKLLGDFFAARR